MIVISISIKNFKSYKDEEPIEFSEGLNLISGHVGSGKSSLFDAFQWVMYDKTLSHSYENRIDFVNIMAKREIEESNQSANLQCHVKLVVEENDIEYTIYRDINLQYDSGKEQWTTLNEHFSISYSDDKSNFIQRDNVEAESLLYNIFPRTIHKYIWFQGESLDELIDFSKPSTLEEAVAYISHLPTLNKMQLIAKDLQDKIYNRLSNKIRADTREKDKFNKKNTELTSRQKELIEAQKGYDSEQKKIAELSKKEDELIEKLKVLADFPQLKKEEYELEAKLKSLVDRVSYLDELEKQKFFKVWMLQGTQTLVNNARVELNKFVDWRVQLMTTDSKQLAEGVPGDELIRKLIKDKECICERPLDPVSNIKEIKAIEKHLDRNKEIKVLTPEIEQMNSIVIGLLRDQDSVKRSTKNITQEITDHKDLILNLMEERNKTKEALKDIQFKIREEIEKKGQDIEGLDSGAISRSREILKDEIAKSTGRYNFYDGRIRDLTRIISELKAAIKELKPNNLGKYPEEEAHNYLDIINGIIVARVAKEKSNLIDAIEKAANEIQKKIIEDTDKNIVTLLVKINKQDYALSFTDSSGQENPGHGAQRTLAKMSIINAILKLSYEKKGKSYPFITDAPTSDFQEDLTNNFIKSVANTFGQSIVILKDIQKDLNSYTQYDFVKSIYTLTKYHEGESALITNSYTKVKRIK